MCGSLKLKNKNTNVTALATVRCFDCKLEANLIHCSDCFMDDLDF